MIVYILCRGDDFEYDIEGVFSNRADAERLMELSGINNLHVQEWDIDHLLPTIQKLDEMSRQHLHIYYLSDFGNEFAGKVIWHGWSCSPAPIDTVSAYENDDAHEFKSYTWWRHAVIKAHTPREAMDIAEKIMVRL